MEASRSRPDGRARPVGLNHVALEVDDVEKALEFYGRLFDLTLRGRGTGSAFIDLGDQFIALSEGREQAADSHRHVGLVVDDPARVRAAAEDAGATVLDTPGLDILDPWGNRLQVVAYEDVQFTKASHVLKGMGLADLEKSPAAIAELQEKGLAPD